jgi:hypothetical protein
VSVRADVDRGLEIVAQMTALKEELKLIEGRLHQAGLHGAQVDLEDAEREGRQYLATGTEQIVPVVFTADQVVKSFLADSAVHKAIAAAAGGHLADFYVPKTTLHAVFESGKLLRRRAAEVLGPQAAPAFVTACLARDKHGIPKSTIKVEWERAEKPAEVAP